MAAPGGSGSTTLSRRTISDAANLKILVPNFDTVPNFDNFVHILAPNFDTPLKVAEIATVIFFATLNLVRLILDTTFLLYQSSKCCPFIEKKCNSNRVFKT